MTKDQILAALPTLSLADLAAIKAATVILMAGGTPDRPPAPNGPQGWLFEALQGAINQPLAYDRFLTTTAGQHFKQKSPVALDFMLRAFGPKAMGNKITALAIMRSLLDLLKRDLIDRDAPLSLGVLASNLGRLDQVFEAAYPGYLRNGIAAMVLRAIRRK